MEYWAGEKLASRPDEKVLKVLQTPLNREKYLAVQNAWIHEFLTESLEAVQGSFLGRLKFEGEAVLLRDPTALQSRGSEA